MEKDHSVKEFFYDISFIDYPVLPSIDYRQEVWFPPHDPNGPRPNIEVLEEDYFRRLGIQERRRFTIPVGNLTAEEVDEIVRNIAARLRVNPDPEPHPQNIRQLYQMQGRIWRGGNAEGNQEARVQNIIDPIWVP